MAGVDLAEADHLDVFEDVQELLLQVGHLELVSLATREIEKGDFGLGCHGTS